MFPINLLGELVAVRLDSGQQLERILLPDWKRSLSGVLLGTGPDVREAKDSVLSGEAIRILKEQDLDLVYGVVDNDEA
jgi:2-keto-3-deoxy-galactonokinase